MNTRRILRFSATLMLTFASAFQIERTVYATTPESSIQLASLSTSLRLSHARELLGSSYAGSLPEKSAQMGSVNDFVFQMIQQHLDHRWKKESQVVTRTILQESQKHGFDPLFVLAVIQTESQYNPGLVGSHGEIGLMQILPNTAKWIAEKENIPWHGKSTLRNPCWNVKIGTAYLSFLRNHFAGHAGRYVAAYNMGPTNVKRLQAQDIQPHEYASRVMGNYYSIYLDLFKRDRRRNSVAKL